MTGLALPYTDPDTGAAYPDAVRTVSDAQVSQSGAYVAFVVSVYTNNDAQMNGMKPIKQEPVTLTPAEVQSQIDPLAAVLYSVLMARPAYSGATFVP